MHFDPFRQAYLLGSLALAPLSATYAVDEPRVVEVELQGVSQVAEQRVLAQLPTQIGATRNELLTNDDIRVLKELGYFSNPTKLVERLPDGNIKVIFRVEELPLIGEVRWQGAGYWLKRDAEKVVKTEKAGYLNLLTLAHDEQAIRQMLAQKKYSDATVRSSYRIDPQTNIAEVDFYLDLGFKIEVGQTEYRGLPFDAFKPLIDQVLINRPGVPFQPDMVPWDSGAVTQYIRDLGYLDAEVTQTQVAYADQVMAYEERARHGPDLAYDQKRNDRAVIRYHLDPGRRYILRSIRFVGQTVVQEQALRDKFLYNIGNIFTRETLRIGDPYRRRFIERGKREALGLLRNYGHAQAFFEEDPVIDPITGHVDLTLRLVEGPKYRIGRVDVSGNTITRDAVVRRGLRLHPGDLWSDAQRDESVRQIRRAGVFTSNDPSRPIRLTPLFGASKPVPGEVNLREVDLLVEVEEEATGSFNFQIGLSSASGVIGQVQFTERNFNMLGLLTGDGWRGAAQTLSANASWTEDRTSLGTSWTNRHIWDSDYSFSLGFQQSDSSLLDWDELRRTTSVSVGRSFFKNDLSLSVGYRYIDLDISDVDQNASDFALDGEGKYWHHVLFARQSYERLNSRFAPTEGFQVSFDQEVAGSVLGGSSDYYTIGFNADLFIPLITGDLGGQTVFHFSQRNRWVSGIGGDSVPFYERIYGGGPAPRFRGFERNDLSPGSTNRNNIFALDGGTTDWVTTFEILQPLQGTNTGIRLVGFLDFGQVWSTADDTDIGDLRSAAGFGIRFPSQFPISLDFAWLLDSEDGEDGTVFHFTLGGVTF